MTFEQGAIAVIGAVVTALCYVCRILILRADNCESDRRELRDEIEQVKEERGMANGVLSAYERCPAENCPFQEDRPVTTVPRRKA